jgi:hypothetical protein
MRKLVTAGFALSALFAALGNPSQAVSAYLICNPSKEWPSPWLPGGGRKPEPPGGWPSFNCWPRYAPRQDPPCSSFGFCASRSRAEFREQYQIHRPAERR